MKAVLHIGTAKTGTTSIQHHLAANRESLGPRGFLYPASLGATRHDALVVAALPADEISLVHRRAGLFDPAATADYLARVEQAFAEELAAADPAAVVLLSSEDVSTYLRTAVGARSLLHWLSRFDLDCDVVVYLRRQDTMQVAAYSTAIKSGSREPFRFDAYPDGEPPRDSRLNYWHLLCEWAEAAGRDRITTRVFERGQMTGGDVVLDFYEQVGLGDTAQFTEPELANASLREDHMEFLRLLNRSVPLRIEGLPNRGRGRLTTRVQDIPSTRPPFAADPQQAQQFLAQFDRINRDVAREFLGRADGVLFRDRPAGDRVSDLAAVLPVQRAAEMAAQLWLQQYSALTRARSARSGPG